jgi:hypothetical protein
MKRKIISALIAAAALLTAVGCGEIEDDRTESSSLSQTESSEDNSSEERVFDANSSFAGDDSSPDSGIVGPRLPEDSSSKSNVVDIEIKTYSGDRVPELSSVVMATLNAAAGEFSEFEKVFDPDILIEAQLRSLVSSEEKRQELRAQYDDESRKMTVRQNYDMLHSVLSGVTFEKEPSEMKIQTVTGELDDSILFELNFDIESSAGTLTFIGKAYHIDGIWGAVFEPGVHKTEEEIQQGLNKKER